MHSSNFPQESFNKKYDCNSLWLTDAARCPLQGAAAPSVPQVLSGTRYVAANTSVVTPIASGTIPLPSAYLDGFATVTGVDIASAYNVYLVGQDNYTNPNTMTTVRP